MSDAIADDPSRPSSTGPGGLYAQLCAPDRDYALDQRKHPLAASLLAIVFPGLGQFYNRQLIRAAWWAIFTLATLLLWGLLALTQWWPFAIGTPGWRGSVGGAIDRAQLAFLIIVPGLWLVGVIDALRVALLLRAGRLVVRFSFRKQAALLAAGMIPLAGALTPDETCAPDELTSSLTGDLARKLLTRLIARKVRRLLMLAVLLAGVIPVILGAAYTIPWLLTLGAAVVLLAMITILTT